MSDSQTERKPRSSSLYNPNLGADMEIEFSVKINVVTGRGCSRQDWIDQFMREVKYEYPHSEVRVVK